MAYSATPYEKQCGIWTIGYGHTRGVNEGDTCTQLDAENWLRDDLAEAESAIANLVDVPLNQNEFDALASFIFNLGATNFENSTLLRRLNSGDRKAAAAQFPRWNKQKGMELPGLTKRRALERQLFERPV